MGGAALESVLVLHIAGRPSPSHPRHPILVILSNMAITFLSFYRYCRLVTTGVVVLVVGVDVVAVPVVGIQPKQARVVLSMAWVRSACPWIGWTVAKAKGKGTDRKTSYP